MSNIEQNALRIAELMGYEKSEILHILLMHGVKFNKQEILDEYSSYNGLMPIVFECNSKSFLIQIRKTCARFKRNNKLAYRFYYNSEPEFIEALQSAVIKYLELKNE